jgi:hypothetical protein
MVPTCGQPPTTGQGRRRNRRISAEQNDEDKGSEEYGPKKTSTFKPSDLDEDQLAADS